MIVKIMTINQDDVGILSVSSANIILSGKSLFPASASTQKKEMFKTFFFAENNATSFYII